MAILLRQAGLLNCELMYGRQDNRMQLFNAGFASGLIQFFEWLENFQGCIFRPYSLQKQRSSDVPFSWQPPASWLCRRRLFKA